MFEIFKNGSDEVNRRLITIELALASFLVAVNAVLGLLPSQDWLSLTQIKITAFVLGVCGAIGKAIELFFNKTASLYADNKAENPQPH